MSRYAYCGLTNQSGAILPLAPIRDSVEEARDDLLRGVEEREKRHAAALKIFGTKAYQSRAENAKINTIPVHYQDVIGVQKQQGGRWRVHERAEDIERLTPAELAAAHETESGIA
jgi:hypothetical protein